MRIRLLTLLLMISLTSTYGQTCMTFEEAQKAGIFESLDKSYKGGLDNNTTTSLFKDQAAYVKVYQLFITDLARFLSANNFKWGKQVRCFNKVYFSKNGRVDYFLYNFKPGDITKEQEATFAKLLASYIKDAAFSLPAPDQFAQCSPVKYDDIQP